MLKLRLNQMIIQEEQIDSKRLVVGSRVLNPSSNVLNISRKSSIEDDATGESIITNMVPQGKKTLSALEMRKTVEKSDFSISAVGIVDHYENPLSTIDEYDQHSKYAEKSASTKEDAELTTKNIYV